MPTAVSPAWPGPPRSTYPPLARYSFPSLSCTSPRTCRGSPSPAPLLLPDSALRTLLTLPTAAACPPPALLGTLRVATTCVCQGDPDPAAVTTPTLWGLQAARAASSLTRGVPGGPAPERSLGVRDTADGAPGFMHREGSCEPRPHLCSCFRGHSASQDQACHPGSTVLPRLSEEENQGPQKP